MTRRYRIIASAILGVTLIGFGVFAATSAHVKALIPLPWDTSESERELAAFGEQLSAEPEGFVQNLIAEERNVVPGNSAASPVGAGDSSYGSFADHPYLKGLVPLPWDPAESESATVSEPSPVEASTLESAGVSATAFVVPLPWDPIESERELGRYVDPSYARYAGHPYLKGLVPQPWDTKESELELNR